MNAGDVLQWYYLIYLVPGGTALLLVLLSVLGGGRHHRVGGGGHGHHAVGAHHHGGVRHTAPGHGAAGPSPARRASALFGFGRVPVPLAWGSLLLGWGLFGYWATRLLQPALHVPLLRCTSPSCSRRPRWGWPSSAGWGRRG